MRYLFIILILLFLPSCCSNDNKEGKMLTTVIDRNGYTLEQAYNGVIIYRDLPTQKEKISNEFRVIGEI